MSIQRYSDFIGEARKNKDESVSALLDMFKNKPKVEMNDKREDKLGKLADQEGGLYSLSGMHKYLDSKEGMDVSGALYTLQNDKNVDIKSINVRVSIWNEDIPYWYTDISKEEAVKLKAKYEKQDKEINKEFLAKKELARKKITSDKTKKNEIKAAKKTSVPKKSANKSSIEKAERKPGSPVRRTKKQK